MPRKQAVDPFEVSGKAPERPKKPTFKQFIKELPDNETTQLLYRIEVIWLPGQWDNYSVETDCFRYSVAKNHPLYQPIDENVIKWLDRDNGILFRVDDWKEGIVGLSESQDFTRWERIGNAGVRCRWD